LAIRFRRHEMQTILVVEDTDLLLMMLSTVLRVKGFQVIEARNGYEALKLLDGRHIDMVITDLIMPGKDGLELTGEIRKLPDYQAIPILMLTTESTAEARREGKNAGVTQWIVKPFVAEDLTNQIRNVLAATRHH
jgi:two-component system, chemotaxis family, chemotaxis protein CheY